MVRLCENVVSIFSDVYPNISISFEYQTATRSKILKQKTAVFGRSSNLALPKFSGVDFFWFFVAKSVEISVPGIYMYVHYISKFNFVFLRINSAPKITNTHVMFQHHLMLVDWASYLMRKCFDVHHDALDFVLMRYPHHHFRLLFHFRQYFEAKVMSPIANHPIPAIVIVGKWTVCIIVHQTK